MTFNLSEVSTGKLKFILAYHHPGNQKVPGSIPGYVALVLLSPCARNFTHIIAPIGSISVGEVANPTVTLMDTFCELGKQMPNMHGR